MKIINLAWVRTACTVVVLGVLAGMIFSLRRDVRRLSAELVAMEARAVKAERTAQVEKDRADKLHDELHELDDFDPIKCHGILAVGDRPDAVSNFVGKAMTKAEAEEFNDEQHVVAEPKTDSWRGEAVVDRDTLRLAWYDVIFEPDEKSDCERILGKVAKEMFVAFGREKVVKTDNGWGIKVPQKDGDAFVYTAEMKDDPECGGWVVLYRAKSLKLEKAVLDREKSK